jgi:hypothetical protein
VVNVDGLTSNKHSMDPALAPGSYWWRIAVLNQAAEKGPFGDPRALRVLAVPAAIAAGSSAISDDGVSIT